MDGWLRVIAATGRILVVLGVLIFPTLTIAAEDQFSDVEVWLDRALPPEATGAGAGGDMIRIGAVVWDRPRNQPLAGWPVALRVVSGDVEASPRPDSTGSAAPSDAVRVREDWPGHVTADVAVPPGGIEAVEFGMVGSVCVNDDCHQDFVPVTLAGVGPPTGAPLDVLADVSAELLPSTPVAGEPIELEILLGLKADWARDTFPTPDELLVEVRLPRGAVLRDAVVALADSEERRYVGSIVVDEPGEYVLQVSVVMADEVQRVFGGSVTPLTVGAPTQPVEPGGDGVDPVIIWIGGLGVVGVLTVLVAVRRLDF